jgi:membrane protein involved in colicin uptake
MSSSPLLSAAREARRQLEEERSALESKANKSAKDTSRLDALQKQIVAASSDIARLESADASAASSSKGSSVRMVEFSVSTVRGVAIQMRAKSSALCAKVVRTFCQQTGAVAGDAAILRSHLGEKFAPDASIGACGVTNGTQLFVTEVVAPATILYRIVDSNENFLEMRSKNSVRLAKVLAGWRSNCPAGSQADGDLHLVLASATDLPLNEAFTLGEYGIKDGTTLRVVRAGGSRSATQKNTMIAAAAAVPPPVDDSDYSAPPVVPPGFIVTPRGSYREAASAEPAVQQQPPAKAPRSDITPAAAAAPATTTTATAAPVVAPAITKKPSDARQHFQQQQQQPSVKIDPNDAFRARWSFETDREREMSLRVDDLVLVVRRKKEWWKGMRARDGLIGWFPATRVVPATPEECLVIAAAVAKVERQPETIKRKERRAQASKGDAEKQLEDKFGAEAPPASSNADAQKEIAELEQLAAAHEADARRVVELMREGVSGRCGESGEIEYTPTEHGHLVRVNARPILLLHGDALEMVIGDDQSLKIEVLLNTVLSAFAFPFVTEFDGDNACLMLVGASTARVRLTAPCTVHRSGRVDTVAPLLSAMVTPTVPTTPRAEPFAEVARLSVPDESLVRFAAWERSGKPRNEITEAYFDVQSAPFREYLLFWVHDRLVRILCEDVQQFGDFNLIFRSDAVPECVQKLRRRLVSVLEANERSSHDYAAKLQLVNSPVLGEFISSLFPVRASLLALQVPSRTGMAPAVKRLGERFMLIEGRLSAEAVVALDEIVRRPPRRASNHSEDDHKHQQHRPTAGAVDATAVRTCRARYTFQARKPEKDLAFTKGDVIRVLYQINDDWLFGEIGTRQGRFPGSFVEFIETPAPAPIVEQSPGQMTIRHEEEMLMDDSDGEGSNDDDDDDTKKALAAEQEIREAEAKAKAAADAAKAKAAADEAKAKAAADEAKAKVAADEAKAKAAADEAAAAAAAAAAATAAAARVEQQAREAERAKREAEERKAKEDAEERERQAAAAAAAAAAEAIQRTSSLRSSPGSMMTADSARSTSVDGGGADVAVEDIKSWRDVLNYAKLKPADVDAYVTELAAHDVDLDQLYDLDIEVAKLVGIKAGHWLRLQKSIAALKEAGFEP